MVSLLTVFGVILVFLILISPILAIVLEEIFSKKNTQKSQEAKVE